MPSAPRGNVDEVDDVPPLPPLDDEGDDALHDGEEEELVGDEGAGSDLDDAVAVSRDASPLSDHAVLHRR